MITKIQDNILDVLSKNKLEIFQNYHLEILKRLEERYRETLVSPISFVIDGEKFTLKVSEDKKSGLFYVEKV